MGNMLGKQQDQVQTMSRCRNRSQEFKEGALAAMMNLENINTDGYRMQRCPYNLGTASHDAWFAGVREGKRMWHVQNAKRELRVRVSCPRGEGLIVGLKD